MKTLQKALFFIVALMAFGRMAWAQSSQTYYLTDQNPQLNITANETLETVTVFANIDQTGYGTVTLTAPQGCYLRTQGNVYSGALFIDQDSFTGDFDVITYTNTITIYLNSLSGTPIHINFTIDIYNPQRIRTENRLNFFMTHGENVKNLRIIEDITLSEYLKVGQNSTQDVTLNLNGHTLSRNLSAVDANGHVIEVFTNGTLTLQNGTLSGGWANNGGGICNFGNLTLNNVNITNCKATDGGGIHNKAGASLTINGGIFSSCQSGAGGGAVVNYGTANITDCTMRSNIGTTRGGAIWSNNNLTISDCTFSGNRAPASGIDGDGGAIHLNGGTTNMTDITITGHTSTFGGGIYVANGATLTITGNNTISDNTCTDGGGIYVAENGSLTITGSTTFSGNTSTEGGGILSKGTTSLSGCTFSGNNCHPDLGAGGGIWTNNVLTLTNCTFTDNHASQAGGIWTNNVLILTNCNFSDNSATLSGGALYLVNANSCSATLTNCNLTGNQAGTGGAILVGERAALTINGGSITGNESTVSNACIENLGTLCIGGNLQVKENTPLDIYLYQGKLINVIGAITSGENSIGVDMELPGVITSGYGTFNHTAMPFFTYGIHSVTEANGECTWVFGYYECSWDATNKTVIHTPKLLTEPYHNLCDPNFTNQVFAQGNQGNLPAGWYIVNGTANLGSKTLECAAESTSGVANVHIILCDNSSINMGGLFVNNPTYNPNGRDRRLHIYCQSYGEKMGKLTSINTTNRYSAGIGAMQGNRLGVINIHGGDIHGEVNLSSHLHDDGEGAGIGAAQYCDASGNYKPINIYDGKVYAKGGQRGAGIGGGYRCSVEYINIYGGNITANGGEGGAGIGTGAQVWSDVGRINVVIHGGTVNATGGDAEVEKSVSPGAGIGVGGDSSGGEDYILYDITINGGRVTAQGGTGNDNSLGMNNQYGAAGIGTGGDCDNMSRINLKVRINGGDVFAYGGGFRNEGKQDGAGIGGGYGSPGGNVYITDGRVVAVAGNQITSYQGGAHAIGAGDHGSGDGGLELPRYHSVRAGRDASSLSLSGDVGRKIDCWNNFYAIIEPCVHERGNWQETGRRLLCPDCQDCLLDYLVEKPYTFTTTGAWNDATNWFHGFVANNRTAEVALQGAATIPNGYTVQADIIDIQELGRLTIEDGGQLLHNNAGVVATVQKYIASHCYDDDAGWNFIASPMAASFEPTEENNFFAADFDLYYYDEPNHLWMNYETESFNLNNGQGYLYANEEGLTLNMTGALKPSNNPVTINNLSHEASALTGFNLVGNPFACNATIDRPFYIIDGRTVVANTGSGIIPPCTGVMVQADAEHESVTFTKVIPSSQSSPSSHGSLQITLTKAPELVEGPTRNRSGVSTGSTTVIDNAIISFDEGETLEKFVFNANNARIYIPQDGKDYAVAVIARPSLRGTKQEAIQTEIPVNFKAEENGTYTLSFSLENMELDYLHLIDNMTGNDVDVLTPAGFPLYKGGQGDSNNPQTASYTFTAKTTDYASRFRLVFATAADETSADEPTFAYYADGEIHIVADALGASLQVVDMTGRIVRSTSGHTQCVPTDGMTPGVYILRLFNGDNVKTQKIVIR